MHIVILQAVKVIYFTFNRNVCIRYKNDGRIFGISKLMNRLFSAEITLLGVRVRTYT